jgi:hypothetical protein
MNGGRVFLLPSLCLPISILGKSSWCVFTCFASLLLTAGKSATDYTEKKVNDFLVPSRDVTNQNHPQLGIV